MELWTPTRERRRREFRRRAEKDFSSSLATSRRKSGTCGRGRFPALSQTRSESRRPLRAWRERHLREHPPRRWRDRRSIVGVALDHQELSVGGSGGRRRIVHVVVGKMFCQAAVDKRNERFLVPGLDDLLGRKRNQRGAGFLRDLQRARGRAGQQLGVGVREKQPRTLGFFRAEKNGVVFADPAGRRLLAFRADEGAGILAIKPRTISAVLSVDWSFTTRISAISGCARQRFDASWR